MWVATTTLRRSLVDIRGGVGDRAVKIFERAVPSGSAKLHIISELLKAEGQKSTLLRSDFLNFLFYF